jgi:hypothetical protein
LDDPSSTVRVSAALALHAMGQTKIGKAALLAELEGQEQDEAELYAINALTKINALGAVPNTWVERTLKNQNKSEYLKRLAKQLAEEKK